MLKPTGLEGDPLRQARSPALSDTRNRRAQRAGVGICETPSSQTAAAAPRFPRARLRRRRGGLQLPAVLAHVAAVLQPAHDAIQPGRIDAELGRGVPNGDARLVADKVKQLLLA